MLPLENQKLAYQLELKHSESTELHYMHNLHVLSNIKTLFSMH